VDQDPTADILIDDIETGIRESDICLADRTADNPNIWYEVGFALANGKPVVMICVDPLADIAKNLWLFANYYLLIAKTLKH
jgi:nucleoside 2-deoxyribosyltransferase